MSGLLAEQDDIKAQIDTAERLAAMPAPEPQTTAQMGVIAQGPAAEEKPYPLGEYLQDIFAVADSTRKGNPVNKPRVVNYQKKVIFNAPTGSNEGVGSEGGFLVGTDMAEGIMSRVYNNDQLVSRADRRTISSGSNSLTENGIDETSRADGSRHGGVRGYWVAEAGEKTASRPKWRQIKNELKKLAVLYYATDEVLGDAEFLQQSVEVAVSDEMSFKIQDSIIRGDGAGKPLGWLNSPCLVTQAKETGQAADTIVYENMAGRRHHRL
jgi:HK97 family phage major capsid protein